MADAVTSPMSVAAQHRVPLNRHNIRKVQSISVRHGLTVMVIGSGVRVCSVKGLSGFWYFQCCVDSMDICS
jgi:hypothetical protein